MIGRVRGHRGRGGEITVRVPSGYADRWQLLDAVTLGVVGSEQGKRFRVESSRSYRDRLVLKLESVDDAQTAAELKGLPVAVELDALPELPEGRFFVQRIVGAEVNDVGGARLGRVAGVIETGGVDVLRIDAHDGRELLVPMAESILVAVDLDRGRVIVDPPEGLLTINER